MKTIQRLFIVTIVALSLAVLAMGTSASASISKPSVKVVELTGAAVATIPIEVPPGRGGLQPNLNLTYNSYQKNGWIGVGWDLSLGAIQRSTKRGVDYSASDFVADGQELVPVSVDTAGNGTYRPKIEGSFAKYSFNHNSGWTVITKDGTKMLYGSTPASRQDDPNNPSRVFKWCLDRVEDTNGNLMTISYVKPNYTVDGYTYLDRIAYTGNTIASQPTTNSVVFHYDDNRSDRPLSYATNFRVAIKKRLQTIEVRSQNNSVSCAYMLAYQTVLNTSFSLLRNLHQFGNDAIITNGIITGGSSLAKYDIDFFTGGDGSYVSYLTTGGPGGNGVGYSKLADVNGDGCTDLIKTDDFGSVYTFLSNCDGTYQSYTLAGGPGGNGPGFIQFADVSGDGASDLIKTTDGGMVYTFLSKGDGTYANYTTTGGPGGNGAGYVQYADVNGDGCADLIKTDASGSVYTFLSTCDGTYQSYTLTGGPGGNGPGFIQFADVSGDGASDLIKTTDGGMVYTFLSKGDGTYANYTTTGGPGGNGAGYVKYSDVNGDGCADLIKTDDFGSVYTFLSNCDGTYQSYTLAGGPGGNGPGFIQFADVSGDGASDLIKTTDGGMVYTFLSKGDGTYANYTTTGGPGGNGAGYVQYADVNGDGCADLIKTDASGSVYTFLSTCDGKGILLNKITTPNDSVTMFEYDNSSSFTNTLLPFIIHPVSKLTIDDGNGVISETNYSYAGGLFDYETREFRGFKEVIQINPDGTTQKTAFYQGDAEADDPEDQYVFKGKINYLESRESASTTSPANLISRVDFTWAVTDALPASQFVYLDEKVTRSYENGAPYVEVHEDNVSFDDWGNLLQAETWNQNDHAKGITKTFEYINLGTDLDPMWRKSMEKIQAGAKLIANPTPDPTNDPTVRQAWYRYTNDGRGNLHEEEHWNDNGANPILRYEYDAYGNVSKEWDAKNQLVAQYTYDTATQTYPVQIVNALGHTVKKEWDTRYGKELWAEDPNGNRTTYTYDEFGRVKQVDLPNGGQTLTTYNDTVVPRSVHTKVKENNRGDFIETHTFYDGFDREIQKLTFGESGQTIVSRVHYDNMGREWHVEGPFFGSGIGFSQTPPAEYPWSKTYFDLRGRPVLTQSPEGPMIIETKVAYDGLTATVTDPDGYPKTTQKDYLGQVVKVTEYLGVTPLVTTYTYNATGDLEVVTDAKNNQIVSDFDSLGRKVSMSDPDMGVWAYEYDVNGNLALQTDANGKQITFDYDALNRITNKRYLNPTAYDNDVTYTYDDLALTSMNPIGNLSRETNGVVTTTLEQYDAMGQVLKGTKTIAGHGAPQSTEYRYDLSGKIEHMVYPDNTKVNFYYYPGSGLLQAVTDVTTLMNYVAYSNYPATGKIKEARFGNNTTTSYTYDGNSARLTSIRALASNGSAIIDKAYDYSAAGDVETITDNRLGYSRTYAYDSLHRLESESNGGGGDLFDFNYDEIGNMITRTAGTNHFVFTPDVARPHAVGTVTVNGVSASYTYDANGNMTSGPDLTNPLNIGTRTFEYNSDNMPTHITNSSKGTIRLYYDGSKRRAKKTTISGSTYYYGEHYEVQNGVGCKFIFAGQNRIAMVKGGSTLYFHKDHLNSSTAITESGGGILEQADYMPFGGQRGTQSITVSNYIFTDQEFDSESGLYNYNARLYDPAIARFNTADSIIPNLFDPQSLNRYAYCRNNPLVYVDPSGYFLKDILDIVEDAISTVFDDWLGIDQFSTGLFGLGFGVELTLSFDNGISIVSWGVGTGEGMYFNASFGDFDIGSSDGFYTTFGRDKYFGKYLSTAGSVSTKYGTFSGSGKYYCDISEYQFGVGYGYDNISINAGHSSMGGWSVGAGKAGFGASYDFHNKRFRGSADARALLSDGGTEYSIAKIRRVFNGDGPEGGGKLFLVVDVLGAVTKGYIAADNHDWGYGVFGRSKALTDISFLKDNLVGGLSNIARGRFGQGIIGIGISPIYYGAVALGGGAAYQNAQMMATIGLLP